MAVDISSSFAGATITVALHPESIWCSSPCIRLPPVLTRRQARYLHDRPDFHGAQACPRMPCGDADRFVEILGVDQVEAAKNLARLRERTVGHEPFAISHP